MEEVDELREKSPLSSRHLEEEDDSAKETEKGRSDIGSVDVFQPKTPKQLQLNKAKFIAHCKKGNTQHGELWVSQSWGVRMTLLEYLDLCC